MIHLGLTLAIAGWLSGILTAGFLFVCVVMILVVLIQRPQGGGLSGAFGSGAGSGQTAFGAKTGDALTIATISIFVVFLLAAVGLNYIARPAGPSTAEAAAATAPQVAPTTEAAPETIPEAAPETMPDATPEATTDPAPAETPAETLPKPAAPADPTPQGQP
jgi:preprotein translocase subunit SecG